MVMLLVFKYCSGILWWHLDLLLRGNQRRELLSRLFTTRRFFLPAFSGLLFLLFSIENSCDEMLIASDDCIKFFN